MSIVDLPLDDLPTFDPRAIVYAPELSDVEQPHNAQDEMTWRNEAATIAVARRSVLWRSPSRHEMLHDAAVPDDRDEIFATGVALSEQQPSASDNAAVASAIRGGREGLESRHAGSYPYNRRASSS